MYREPASVQYMVASPARPPSRTEIKPSRMHHCSSRARMPRSAVADGADLILRAHWCPRAVAAESHRMSGRICWAIGAAAPLGASIRGGRCDGAYCCSLGGSESAAALGGPIPGSAGPSASAARNAGMVKGLPPWCRPARSWSRFFCSTKACTRSRRGCSPVMCVNACALSSTSPAIDDDIFVGAASTWQPPRPSRQGSARHVQPTAGRKARIHAPAGARAQRAPRASARVRRANKFGESGQTDLANQASRAMGPPALARRTRADSVSS